MMAHILPDIPPISLPGEVLRVFRTLKALPDSLFIWHHLAPWQPNAPDFLIIHQDGRALLVKVSSAAARPARRAAQFLLLESERAPLGVAEAKVLTDFVATLKLPDEKMLETLIIFPNIPDEQVQAGRLARDDGGPAWAGKELLNPEAGDSWNRFFPSAKMNFLWLEKVLQRFTPEIVIPAEMTVRPPLQRRLEAGLSDYLLDYDQEWAACSQTSSSSALKGLCPAT